MRVYLQDLLRQSARHVRYLIPACIVLYVFYTSCTKLATESYGGNINGLELAPWVSLVAVILNMSLCIFLKLFSWHRIKKDWKKFSISGAATGFIIMLGTVTLVLKIIKLTEAATLLKAEAIPASLVATLLFIKVERTKLLKDLYQLLGGAVALVAIYLSLTGMAKGKIGSLPIFVICLLVGYALACLIRFPIMRTDKGDKLEYFAGEQLFAAIFVVGFLIFIAYGNLNIVPNQIREQFLSMNHGLHHPSWEMLKWAIIIGTPFAFYAPISVLLLMYNSGGSTVLLGAIMQKLAGVGGAVGALPMLHLLVWLFFSDNTTVQVPWYDKRELQSLGLFFAATCIALVPHIRVFFRERTRGRKFSLRRSSLVVNTAPESV